MKKIGLLAVLLCLLALGGCDNAKETLSQMRAELRQDILNEETPNQTTNADSAQNSEENLQVPDAKDITIEETYQTVQTVAQTSGEEMSVALYFADENGEKLVKCEKKIPKAEGHRPCSDGDIAGRSRRYRLKISHTCRDRAIGY